MKLTEICLLKEHDKVIVNGKEKTVKETAKNETIKIADTFRYYSEIQTVDSYRNKAKHNNYNMHSFVNKEEK